MTKPLVFNYGHYERLRDMANDLIVDNQKLMDDNRKLRKEVEELKKLNDGYEKIIAKNQETNNKLMASVQKQTGGDLISRADAIEAVAKLQKYDLDERNRLRIYAPWHNPKRIFVETEAIYKTIYTLPSADAVQGEWEHWGSPFSDESEVIDTIVCSVCGARFIEPKDEPKGEYNYCPNCGAKMKGGEE